MAIQNSCATSFLSPLFPMPLAASIWNSTSTPRDIKDTYLFISSTRNYGRIICVWKELNIEDIIGVASFKDQCGFE